MGRGTSKEVGILRIFVHLDAGSACIGNGGFLMLTQLAKELAGMGYEVYVFDLEDRLNWFQFVWLSHRTFGFDIASFDSIGVGDVVITSWVNALLDDSGELVRGLSPEQIRVWCQDELLRVGEEFDKSRAFVDKYVDTIAINNGEIKDEYRAVGIDDVIVLDNWIRSLFRPREQVIDGGIGYQSDNGVWVGFEELREQLYSTYLIICEGTQEEVAYLMGLSDKYICFNRFKEYIHFSGEGFGLSTYEAMACGCAVVSRGHRGNQHLEDTIILVDSIQGVIDALNSMSRNQMLDIRSKSLALIEERYRWDGVREQAVKDLIGL